MQRPKWRGRDDGGFLCWRLILVCLQKEMYDDDDFSNWEWVNGVFTEASFVSGATSP